MPRFEVAIATRDPRTLYRSVELLKRLNLHFIVCAPDEPECQAAGVVVATNEDAVSYISESHIVRVDDSFDDEYLALEIMTRLSGIVNAWVGVIGIDPGMRYGLALILDSHPLHTATESTPACAVNHTKRWLEYLSSRHENCKVIVRVGTGSHLYSALYLRQLIYHLSNEYTVEMVDEQYTSVGFEDHGSSAILIGSRQGREMIPEDTIIELKEGYVKSLKQLVARATEGMLKLSNDEARLILLDRLSIKSVLEDIQSEKKDSTC
jgi:hypothetical protein